MQSDSAGTGSGGAPGQIPVSPNNPCPFLRALVAGGFVGGHVVPLATLSHMVGAASGEKGLKKKQVGIETCMVALIANGLSPLRLLRSWWSGAVLDELRNGPLDKHGVGSRILEVDGKVNEAEIARLAEFGQDCKDPAGGTERGLTSAEITTYMKANFDRARDNRRWYDPILMKGEWPVLLNIIGKGEGEARYLSVAEVSTLFNERRLPQRIVERLAQPAPVTGGCHAHVRQDHARGDRHRDRGAGGDHRISRSGRQASCRNSSRRFCRLPCRRFRRPGRRIGSTRTGRPRTDTGFTMRARAPRPFRCPTSWFVALEQPGIHLFTEPGLMKDSRLSRTVRLPAEPANHSRRRSDLGHASAIRPRPRPARHRPPVENFDGLPVGFARLTGAVNPGNRPARIRQDRADLRGLSHRKHSLQGRQRALRRRPGDGGPEKARNRDRPFHRLHRHVPGRFNRFADPRARPRRGRGRTRRAQKGPDGDAEIPVRATKDLPKNDRRHEGLTTASRRRTPRKGTDGSTRSTGSAIRSSTSISQRRGLPASRRT